MMSLDQRSRTMRTSLLLAGLVACGDDTEGREDGAGGASTAGTSDTSTTTSPASSSGGSGGDTGAGTGAGGGPRLPFVEYGRLSLERGTSDLGDGPEVQAYVGAYFVRAPDPTPAPFAAAFGTPSAWCTAESVGACEVYSCEPGVDADWSLRVDQLGAGTVTVEGLPGPIALEPSDDRYTGLELELDDVAWTGGDSIVFSAEGDEVPAFSLEVVAPARVTLSSPPAYGQAIDSGEDLTLSWTDDGEDGRVLLFIVGSDESSRSFEIVCEAASTDDGPVVPSAALSRVSGEVFFGVITFASNEVAAGNVAVRADVRDYYSTWVVVE